MWWSSVNILSIVSEQIFDFLLNIFKNAFIIKDAHRSDGRFATKIGAKVSAVGEFGELHPLACRTANCQTVYFQVPISSDFLLSWMPGSESYCFRAFWCIKNCPIAKNVIEKNGICSQKFDWAKKPVSIWPTHRFMGTPAFVLILQLIYQALFLDRINFLTTYGAFLKTF